MAKPKTAFQKTLARLKAKREELRGAGTNRKKRETPHAYAFSKNAAAGPKKVEVEE